MTFFHRYGIDASFTGRRAGIFTDRTFNEINIDGGLEYTAARRAPANVDSTETVVKSGTVKSLHVYGLRSIWKSTAPAEPAKPASKNGSVYCLEGRKNPGAPIKDLWVSVDDGTAAMETLKAFRLKSIWNTIPPPVQKGAAKPKRTVTETGRLKPGEMDPTHRTFASYGDVGYDQTLRPQFHFTSRKNWLTTPTAWSITAIDKVRSTGTTVFGLLRLS